MSSGSHVKNSGFTFMEAMVTVSIVGIMAGVAVPNYQRAVHRARLRAARDILLAIYNGEQIYKLNNGSYVNISSTPVPNPAWDQIFMEDPNVQAPAGYKFQAFGVASLLAFVWTAQDGVLLIINEFSYPLDGPRVNCWTVGVGGAANCPAGTVPYP